MNKDKAIQLLERLQDPEPYEPMLTKDAYDAIQMAIDALENQKSVCEEYCEYEDCEAEKMVVQSLSSLYPLKEFEEIAIDKVLDAVKQPKRIRGKWIPVTERLPEEREWLETKRFGTTISDEVYVTFENPKGERFCTHLSFQNGKLSRHDQSMIDAIYNKAKPIAWMPLPEPYKGVTG